MIVLMVVAFPSRAGAVDDCEATAAEFVATFPELYEEANTPAIECAADLDGTGHTAQAQPDRVLVSAHAPGIRYVIAHEMGHVWQLSNAPASFWEYRDLRGFPEGTGVRLLQEDHADLIAYVLGWWAMPPGTSSPAPYRFQHAAGPPTDVELVQLWIAGWIPGEIPWPAGSVLVPD